MEKPLFFKVEFPQFAVCCLYMLEEQPEKANEIISEEERSRYYVSSQNPGIIQESGYGCFYKVCTGV